MFTDPASQSITRLTPAACYDYIFPRKRFDLTRISYYFDHDMGDVVDEEHYADLLDRVARWQASWKDEGKHPVLRYRKALHARERRYADAFARGFGFLDRLVIQDRDASVLPNPEYAVGGLHANLHKSHVRVDFVQHALAAILTFEPDVFVTPPKGGPAWPRRSDRAPSSKSRPDPSEATE